LRFPLDIGLIRLDGVPLRLESRAFVLFLEEAVKRIGKMLDARLNRSAIDFLQPVELLLQQRKFFGTRTGGQSFSGGLVRFLPLRQEVVEDEARTSYRLRNQDFLLFCRVDSELVGLVFQHHFSPPLKGIYPKGRLVIPLPLSLRLEMGVFSPNFDKTCNTTHDLNFAKAELRVFLMGENAVFCPLAFLEGEDVTPETAVQSKNLLNRFRP